MNQQSGALYYQQQLQLQPAVAQARAAQVEADRHPQLERVTWFNGGDWPEDRYRNPEPWRNSRD